MHKTNAMTNHNNSALDWFTHLLVAAVVVLLEATALLEAVAGYEAVHLEHTHW
jgi:hypothetical protein